MPIPHSESAVVPEEKLTGYLLNLAHPVGGPKARWFVLRGFDAKLSTNLEYQLLGIVRASDDFVEEMTLYGAKYIVRGTLECPDGSRPRIVTVWIVETGSLAPRFVTAYPDEVDS